MERATKRIMGIYISSISYLLYVYVKGKKSIELSHQSVFFNFFLSNQLVHPLVAAAAYLVSLYLYCFG